MELRGRGWTIVAAAREVGISRTAANNWAGGYKVYRKGQVVGVVTPLDRLTVREISPRYLSQEERIEIADLHHAGVSVRKIATQLGRAPSTVSRELRRSPNKCGYRPFEAHRQATSRRARDHKRRVEKNSELRRIVGELLAQRWSPQQIARHLRAQASQRPVDVVVPREHLPGDLSARLRAPAAFQSHCAEPFASANRA